MHYFTWIYSKNKFNKKKKKKGKYVFNSILLLYIFSLYRIKFILYKDIVTYNTLKNIFVLYFALLKKFI
jgi:hypothetical protein